MKMWAFAQLYQKSQPHKSKISHLFASSKTIQKPEHTAFEHDILSTFEQE